MRPSQLAKICMCDMPDLNIAVTIMLFQSFNSMLKRQKTQQTQLVVFNIIHNQFNTIHMIYNSISSQINS
jgi:hypothetical protein